MGGLGSGNRWRSSGATCEGNKRIDLKYLKKRGWLQPGCRYSLGWNMNGEPSGNINYSAHEGYLLLDFKMRDYGEVVRQFRAGRRTGVPSAGPGAASSGRRAACDAVRSRPAGAVSSQIGFGPICHGAASRGVRFLVTRDAKDGKMLGRCMFGFWAPLRSILLQHYPADTKQKGPTA